MKFLLMVYNDDSLLDALPANEADGMMRQCFQHADGLRDKGTLLGSQQLEPPSSARTVRVRNHRMVVVDGPFAEAKEYLGGFNLIEAKDMDEAIEIASHFPWTRTGCIEIRAVKDLDVVRRDVGL